MQKNLYKEIKIFGLAIAIVLSFISLKLFKSGKIFYEYISIVALAFFTASVLFPKAILPLFRICNLLRRIVGWLITNAVLILIFYLVITPIGLFLRLFSKDLLALKKTNQGSYWIRREEVIDLDSYIKQY